MKKGKKVYVLAEWTSSTCAEYTVFYSRKEVYFNRPYQKTFYKAKKTYNWPWANFDFWPHCVIDCYDSIDSFNCGKDPVYTKTYYK